MDMIAMREAALLFTVPRTGARRPHGATWGCWSGSRAGDVGNSLLVVSAGKAGPGRIRKLWTGWFD